MPPKCASVRSTGRGVGGAVDDVEGAVQHVGAPCAERVGNLPDSIGAAVEQGETSALGRERPGRGRTDAAGSAGHDHHLVVQTEVHDTAAAEVERTNALASCSRWRMTSL